jgi:hypothetical protein
MKSSSVPQTPATVPTLGRARALSIIVAAMASASRPASWPICSTSSPCALGYSEAVSHSSSTSSGAIDSTA